VLPPLRSDYKALENYRYQPGTKLTCPISGLVGERDPKATVEEVSAWGAHTAGPFGLEVFPGGHFYLNDQLAEIAEIIRARISSACPASAAMPGIRSG